MNVEATELSFSVSSSIDVAPVYAHREITTTKLRGGEDIYTYTHAHTQKTDVSFAELGFGDRGSS